MRVLEEVQKVERGQSKVENQSGEMHKARQRFPTQPHTTDATRVQNLELQHREMPTARALITVSIQEGLIYVVLGEKETYPEPEEKHSEEICKESSVTGLSLPVYFHSNISNKPYHEISNGHT